MEGRVAGLHRDAEMRRQKKKAGQETMRKDSSTSQSWSISHKRDAWEAQQLKTKKEQFCIFIFPIFLTKTWFQKGSEKLFYSSIKHGGGRILQWETAVSMAVSIQSDWTGVWWRRIKKSSTENADIPLQGCSWNYRQTWFYKNKNAHTFCRFFIYKIFPLHNDEWHCVCLLHKTLIK